MVSNAPHTHRFLAFGAVRKVLVDLFDRFPLEGTVTVPEAVHGNSACIKSAPQKIACQPLGAFGEIPLVAALVQDLHKTACVTKGVDVHRDLGLHTEFFLEIFSTE